jgi:hypothetical protein
VPCIEQPQRSAKTLATGKDVFCCSRSWKRIPGSLCT